MKKLSLLFFVLFISFSFGQTKKKTITNSSKVKESEMKVVQDGSMANYKEPMIIGDPDATERTVIVDENKIYDSAEAEVKPEYPGGTQKFFEFVGKNYKVPEEKGLMGKVYVSFIIEKDGTLSDIKVLRDIGYGTGEEAIRVLKLSPKWSPGELNGRKIKCRYALPITLNYK